MKSISKILFLPILILACQPQASTEPSEAQKAFERNAETVKSGIDAWESENINYSIYANDYSTVSTMFGADKDTMRLEQMMESDQRMLDIYDFEFIGEFVPLPGVNPETKEMDGSVRHYCTWKVTKSATDSTEERSGMIDMYETYEFNEAGEIISSQGYGDFTGIITYLNGDMDGDDTASE